MNYAIGVKMVMFSVMEKGMGYEMGAVKEADKPITLEDAEIEGYLVDYGDYKSWSPKDVFEKAYYPIEDKTKITSNDVDNFIVKGEPFKLGTKTTLVLDTTITGFDTVATSSCVDPINFNIGIGAEIARKDIKDKIWGHLGFVLQWANNSLKFNTIK